MVPYELKLVFLAFLAAQAFGHIYRLPCKKFAEFSIVEKDSGLNSDAVYKILDNTNKNICRDECIRHSGCKAFSTNGESCELYTKTTEDSNDGVNLESRPGWTYYSTYYGDTLAGPNCRLQNPCPGMQCTDICGYPGYRCQDIVYHRPVYVHVQYITAQPAATTAQPVATTVQPVVTTAQPVVTSKPVTVTRSAGPTAKPATVTKTVRPTTKPVTMTKSVRPTTKPASVTKSVRPTTKPGTVTKSVRPTTKPASVTKSVRPTTKPGTVTKSVRPTTKPGTVTKSVRPTTKPASVTKSVRPTTKPVSVTKSVRPTTKPGTVTKSVRPTTKPGTVTKSVRPTTKPVTVTKPKEECEDPCKYGFCAAHPAAFCRRSKTDRCKPEFYFQSVWHPDRIITDCGTICVNKCIGSGSMISTGVCGTNGEYYKTVCLLNIAKCNSKGKIGDHQVGKCCKTKVKITSQGYLSDKKPKGSGGHSKISVKDIYGSGSQRWSSMERGYNVYVIHEYEGGHFKSASFDTFEDDNAKDELKKFIGEIPKGMIVLVAIQDEGTRKASQEVYEALKKIHGTEPFQTQYRGAFAMIGYKGTRKPYWVQQVVQRDLRKDAVIEAEVLLRCSPNTIH